IAKEIGALTVAVVTRPFAFEGRKRMHVANDGLKELGKYVDSLITIPNEKLVSVLGKDISLLQAFKAANDVLLGAVQGIAELITREGLINVDFADVRTVMSEMGMAMMGTGTANGAERAREATEMAIASPLLEDVDLMGARGILVNVTAGPDLSMGEFHEVGQAVEELAAEDAVIVVGTVLDPEMGEQMRVTVVATGIGSAQVKAAPEEAPVKLVQRKKSGEVDYEELDRPTVIRRRVANEQFGAQPEADLDYLDIPAFLRKQAD
ncbi:MAG: cell division protein FtsZ, partial [Gammaproteobacteria bacterium]